MLRPEPAWPLTPNVEPTRPAAATGAGGQFAPLFGEVSAEVGRFIRQGSTAGADLVGSAATLSPEAQLLRNATRGAGVDDVSAVDAPGRRDFVAGIRPWASEAARQLGVSTDAVIAHAALESGWGRKPLRADDGSDSHNLFGIKAGGAWRGATVEARTTEYLDGSATQVSAAFRSYADGAAAFRDYARLLLDNPRYAGALNAGADVQTFAAGLVQGGYATDPDYAGKLVRLAGQIRAQGY